MFINTANKPVPTNELGAILMHEHLVASFAGWEGDTTVPPRRRDELVHRCVDRIEELKAGGFSSLLDPCPNDLGRDVELYAEVAARTGFNILFATGIYNEHYSSPYWRFKLEFDPAGVEYLTAMYIKELTEGVGPSRLKPAVIKLAIGLDPNSVFENKAIAAAAAAANETMVPILTHTEGAGGDLLLEKLKARGVPAHRIIIGHSCGSPDVAYHRRIVDGGAYIGFDRFGFVSVQSDQVRADSLYRLLVTGFAQQAIVSHDCCFCQRGNLMPDELLYTNALHFVQNIAPRLRERGISQSVLDGIFRDNPRRYFSSEVPARENVAELDAPRSIAGGRRLATVHEDRPR
jgi:phosphotriesterase-related protein